MQTTHEGTLEELGKFLTERAAHARALAGTADKAHKTKFDGVAEGLKDAAAIVAQWRLPGEHAPANGQAREHAFSPPGEFG